MARQLHASTGRAVRADPERPRVLATEALAPARGVLIAAVGGTLIWTVILTLTRAAIQRVL